MDLMQSPHQQLETLANWLEANSRSDATPGQQTWESFRQQMEDRAIFIRTFMLRNMDQTVPSNIPASTLDRTGTMEEGARLIGERRPDFLQPRNHDQHQAPADAPASS